MSTLTLTTTVRRSAPTDVLRQTADAVARFIRIRRDLAQVRQLDDHLLRDIGLTRLQADQAVRFGRIR